MSKKRVYNPKTKQYEEVEETSVQKKGNESINAYNPSSKHFEDLAPVRKGNESVEAYNPNTKKFEEIAPVKKDTNKWFKGGAFEEDSGLGVFETPTDIAKTILGTGADAFTKVGSTLWNMGGEIGKLGAGGVAQVADWIGQDEWADKVRNRIAGKDEKTNERLENLDLFNKTNKIVDKNSVLGDKSDSMVESIGQIGGYAAATAINPAFGNAVMFGTSAGSSLGENYGKENVTDAQAWTNALAKGGIAVATEKAFGLFSKGKGIDTTIANKISSKLKSGAAKTFARLGVQATGEAVEEFLEYLGDQLLDLGMDATSNGKGAKFHEDWNWEELGAQMGNAFISSLLVGTGTNALGIAGSEGNNLKEKVNNFAIQQDIINNAKSRNEQKVINLLVQEQIDEKTKNNEKINKKEIKEQVEKDLEKGYVDIEKIEQALGGELYDQYQNILNQQEELNNKIEEYKNMKDNDISVGQREEYNKLKQDLENLNVEGYKNQLRDYVNNLTQNDPFIRNSYNEYNNKGVAYQIDETKNYSDKELEQIRRAQESNLINNTNAMHELMDNVAKIHNDKGIWFNFVNSEQAKEHLINKTIERYMKNNNITELSESQRQELYRKFENEFKDRIVNGYVDENGEVYLNVDSAKYLNAIMGHEIMHLFESDSKLYKQLRKEAIDFAKTKEEYKARLEQIGDNYNEIDSDLETELVNDIIGDYLFTDEAFVKKLSTNKNLFQKIYDEIKYLANVITGRKEQAQIQKVKNLFERVYRQQDTNIPSNTQFSIAGIEGINNLPDSKYKQDALSAYEEAQNKAKQNVDNEEIRKQTKWYQDKNGDWKFEIDDSSITLDNNLIQKNGEYKLSDVIDHKLLFKLYPQLKDYNVKFDDMKTNGSFLKNDKLIKINNKYIENADYKELKGTILHEVQHAIQHIEGYESGMSSKFSKKAYYNKLGEIEANDTKQRYMNDLDKEARKEIAPESSKKNPKHSEYDSYMKNRKTIDKVKDSVYSIFDRGDSNVKKNQKNISDDSRENSDMVVGRELLNEELDNSSFSNTKYSISEKTGKLQENGKDIKLDTSDTGTTGTLMAMHNLSEDKMNGLLELNGIPVPSIAITNPEKVNHSQFGDGTLIFDKSTIDPAVKANEVYDRDVWSPTFPQIDYELNDDAIDRVAENLGLEAWRVRDAAEDNSKPEYLVERLLREEKLIDKYVKDNNLEYETTYKDAETKVDFHQRGDKIRKFIIDNDFDFKKLYKNKTLQQEYFNLIKDYYDNSSFPEAVKENLYNEKITQLKDFIDIQKGAGDVEPIRQLKRYQDDFDLIKSGENKVVDTWQTEKNKKDVAIKNGIEDYIKNEIKEVYGDKGIRNDIDLFTPSGNRRSFWQLHDEYNLENIVDALTQGDTTGTQNWIAGYGQIQANMANQFNSIEDIKANENRLTSLAENNTILEEARNNIENDIDEIVAKNDTDMNIVSELLADFARGDLTIDNFRNLTENYYQTTQNVSDELINKIIDDMNALKNLPTDYFEAKPQRAVGLDEIGVAVIPNTWSNETKQALKEKGIDYIEYDPKVEGDRQRVENMYDNFKFSILNENEEIAPIGNYRIKGEDIKLQDIAPIVNQNIENNTENNVKNNARDKYDYIYEDFGKNINNNSSEDIAPINTKEQKKQVNFQQKDIESFIPDVIKRQYEQLRNKNGNNETELEVNKSKLRQATDTFREMFVNQNNEIDHLAKDTNNMAIKHKGDMINSAIAEAQNDINVGQTDNYGRTIGKSVTEAFRPAKQANLEVPFNDYLLHWTNIERNKYGKGSNIPSIVSEQLVQDYEKTYPQFKIWGKDVWQIGKNALKNQLDSGLINQDQYNFYDKNYAHYVPFMENVDMSKYIDDTGEIKARKTIKKSKGGANQYNMLPVEEAIAKYIYSQKMSVRQNELYKEIVNTLYKDGDNTNPSGMYDPSYADMKDSLYTDENGNYLTAFVDGESKSVKISDDLYKSLKNDTATRIKNLEERLSLLTKPLQKVSNVRRKILVDWNPTFIVKNFLKDFQDATLNSKYTKDFFKNYPNAVKELLANNTDRVKQFRNLYGSGTLGEYDTKSKNAKFLGRLATMNETIELAPRYAEFISSLENGTSVEEALYNAKEVTTNFGRGGTITKALNRNGATFLNASVQGFSKFIRNFSGENGAKGVVNSLAKAAIFGIAPAVFNELAFGAGDDKDEEYEALPDYIKDNYYIIKLSDGTFVRIPKGRMLSVFGSAARRTLELAEGEEDAFEGYGNNAWNQVGVNAVGENNILAPLTQAFGSENGEAWYGGDIVPYRLQKEKPEDQFDEKTDEFSKFLGKMLKVSPKKINYVIDQYSGGVGDIVLPLITKEATSNTNNPLGIALAPIKDQFVVDSTSDNKYAGDFYDTKDNLYTGSKATDEDLIKAEYMSDISYELSKLYKEKREIQNSDLPRDERFKKSQAIQDQINALAKEGLDNYQDVQKADKYAIVNDREYYKNANDEWKAVKDEDIDELNSMGMNIQEKSNFYNAKNKIYTTTENYKKILEKVTDEDEKSAIYHDKKVEIINTIKNTKMSDAGKAYLYDKYYGDTDTLNGLVDLKVDMNQYLDLEMQDFTADKYANGKTIPNSKKNKVFNYINQMNIPYEQKLLLAKIKYSSYDAGNRTIIQYLNNSGMSYEDEVKFLKKLGFKVSKDGRITWS